MMKIICSLYIYLIMHVGSTVRPGEPAVRPVELGIDPRTDKRVGPILITMLQRPTCLVVRDR